MNLQIQHLVIAVVWLLYLISHLRLTTIILLGLGVAILIGIMGYLDQSGVLTFAPFEHTRGRATRVFSEEGRQERRSRTAAADALQDIRAGHA